jgi:hypothetical protein
MVYCALTNKLLAINSDGSLKWSFNTGAINSEASAVGADGTVYVGAWGNPSNFFAVNPDGTLKWSFACDYNSGSSPAIGADGAIYFGAGTNLNALNPDGSLRWSFAIPPSGGEVEGTSSSPAIGEDGTIYFADNGGNFYAVNPDGNRSRRHGLLRVIRWELVCRQSRRQFEMTLRNPTWHAFRRSADFPCRRSAPMALCTLDVPMARCTHSNTYHRLSSGRGSLPGGAGREVPE